MPNPAKHTDVNTLLQSEVKQKNQDAVDNMFIKAGFFNQFMEGNNPETLPQQAS